MKSTVYSSCITWGTSECICDSQFQTSPKVNKTHLFIGKVASKYPDIMKLHFVPSWDVYVVFPHANLPIYYIIMHPWHSSV